MKYEHTQIGKLMIYTLIAVCFLYTFILFNLPKAEIDSRILSIMILIVTVLSSFATLKVWIDEKYLRLKFGYGLFSKRFLLTEIVSAERVKNHWYNGWGIRAGISKNGSVYTIFNVSGYEAVEIRLINGNVYRIGTDEPEHLKAAIQKEMVH